MGLVMPVRRRAKVNPISDARAALVLAEPRIRPAVVGLFKAVAPLYFHLALGFRSLELRHEERIVEAYRAFFDGKIRLLVAFRHPYGDEAQLMAYLIGKLLAREARLLGGKLAKAPHAHFVHGYEVPLWGGPFERWLLPRVGAVPVYHEKLDQASLARIRRLMLDGGYPLALAPEGQVSYTSEALPRLESGATRIASWCVEDLAAEGRSEDVVILPISVHHRWDPAAGRGLDALIGRTERLCGIAPPAGAGQAHDEGPEEGGPTGGAAPAAGRHRRLAVLAERLLALAERHYSRFYGAVLPRAGEPGMAQRLADLREAALRAAESALGLRPEGDVIRRVYRIRQVSWDRIFRADLGGPEPTSQLELALADRVAGEAWYASRHMELVDLAYYLDFDRLKPEDPLELYVETAQNYYDLASRLSGGNISDRIGLRGKRATVIVGEPLRVTDSLAKSGSRKTALESLNEELKRSFEACIAEIREDRKHG